MYRWHCFRRKSIVLKIGSCQSVNLDQNVVSESEDVPIPNVDDLVIESLTDQMIDFDEHQTDVLEIFADERNEKTMTDEDRKSFRKAKEAQLQSWLDRNFFSRYEQEGSWQRSRDESSMEIEVELPR